MNDEYQTQQYWNNNMKKSELKQISKEEIRKVLNENLNYFKPYGKEYEEVYEDLNFDDQDNLELVFIYFRGLKNEKKARFIPQIQSPRNNTDTDRENYNMSHTLDYVDVETGDVFSIVVLDEDWFESIPNIYPADSTSLEMMKRENLV
jgi:hypothetical protein